MRILKRGSEVFFRHEFTNLSESLWLLIQIAPIKHIGFQK